MQLDTATWREGEGENVCAEGHQPARTCVHGWHSPLGSRGSSQAVALGSSFGHLLERQVREGNTKLCCTNPFHLPQGRAIALGHSHEMHFSLKLGCRKALLSWSALFWV